jgi:hypothetical protein
VGRGLRAARCPGPGAGKSRALVTSRPLAARPPLGPCRNALLGRLRGSRPNERDAARHRAGSLRSLGAGEFRGCWWSRDRRGEASCWALSEPGCVRASRSLVGPRPLAGEASRAAYSEPRCRRASALAGSRPLGRGVVLSVSAPSSGRASRALAGSRPLGRGVVCRALGAQVRNILGGAGRVETAWARRRSCPPRAPNRLKLKRLPSAFELCAAYVLAPRCDVAL